MNKTRVVVMGAGFAGLAAVRNLPRDDSFEITLVDQRNHHLFQALLYQVASAGLNPSEIASPVRAIFRDRKNVRVLMGEVTAIDREKREVSLDHGRLCLEYDYAVLAVGGRTSYFGNDHWAEHSFGLKSIEEALAIRKRVLLAFERAETCTDPEERKALMTIAVIGGGPTGVELSGAFAELRSHVLRWDFRSIDPGEARIVLIEGSDRLLYSFPPPLSSAALGDIQDLGVEVWLNHRVTDIGPGVVRVGDRELRAHTVVWAGGVQGHELTLNLGLNTIGSRQVVVDPDLRPTGEERLFCAGDIAFFPTQWGALPAMAPVAMQQGEHAGKCITALARGQETTEFSYQDTGIMATVGRSRGVAYLNGKFYTGTRGWATWLWHHLLRIVDFQNRVMVVTRWAWAYLGWKWGVRLVYGSDQEEELRCGPGEPRRCP